MTLVLHVLEAARRRLAVLSREASLFDAAEILANPDTPLAVVCDSEGIAAGVITPSDVVKILVTAGVDACWLNAEAMMAKPVLSCRLDDPLQGVWGIMNSRYLRSVPILDGDGRPIGVLYARDVAKALLDEATHEELLLRDYVMGVGYQ
jgi:CBS domain-containing protein